MILDIKCRELHNIILEKYPYSQSLNERLIKDLIGFSLTRNISNEYDRSDTNVKALQTLNNIESPNISLLITWVLNLIRKDLHHIGVKFSVKERWIANYNIGDYTTTHIHSPAMYAFVYFIKAPLRSSPLVFTTSGKKIKAEEGKIVIFPGNLYHHVPKNKCDGRITLSGNIHTSIE